MSNNSVVEDFGRTKGVRDPMGQYSKPTITVMGTLHGLTQADFAKGLGAADAINVSVGPVSTPQSPVPVARGYVHAHVKVLQGGFIISGS